MYKHRYTALLILRTHQALVLLRSFVLRKGEINKNYITARNNEIAGVSVIMRSQPKGVNLLKPKTYFMYHQLEHSDILCSPQHEFMCFAWISEQTAIISLHNINISDTAHRPAQPQAISTNTHPPRKNNSGPDSPTTAEKQEP